MEGGAPNADCAPLMIFLPAVNNAALTLSSLARRPPGKVNGSERSFANVGIGTALSVERPRNNESSLRHTTQFLPPMAWYVRVATVRSSLIEFASLMSLTVEEVQLVPAATYLLRYKAL